MRFPGYLGQGRLWRSTYKAYIHLRESRYVVMVT